MSQAFEELLSLPPRLFIRTFWVVQRAVSSITGGRFGLRDATADRWGMLRACGRLGAAAARSERPSSATSRTAPIWSRWR